MIQVILDQISRGDRLLSVTGLEGSSKAYLLSRLIREGPQRTFLYVAATGKEAVRLLRDLQFFLGSTGGELLFFPPPDVLPFAQLSPHNDITCDRLRGLHLLAQRAPRVVVTTGTALLPPLPPKEILQNPLTVRKGMEIDRTAFLQRLAEWGYQNIPLVIDRGHVAVRGALVDLFSPLYPDPLRIEWLGDRIESIRSFDPKTQRSLTFLETASILPVREILLNDETRKTFSTKARQQAEAKQLPRSSWAPLVEKVREGIFFAGIETYLPLFYPEPTSFWDWLPEETLLVTDDRKPVEAAVENYLEEVRTLTRGQEKLIDPPELLLGLDLFKVKAGAFPHLTFSLSPGTAPITFQTETHAEIRREIELSKKGLEPLAPLARRIKEWQQTDTLFLVASSPPQAQRIKDLLSPYFSAPLPVVVGELSQGFRLPSGRITFVTEEEIFGPKVRRPREPIAEASFSSLAELKEGDPIVHQVHGIGIYRGLVPLSIEGVKADFLLIEYQGGDKLYLPVYRMNLVQRYTGADGRRPRIDRLGASAWQKIKGRAEKAIREMAGELLNLYAARSAGKGFAFSPPNDLFEAFEGSFPFEETPDQEAAIAEVLRDMQRERPMDRLVLGDVGYGKTEVALRAAFKAALDGKQSALLVPTTVLAFQHTERFRERFRDYPVSLAMLSRFQSPREQKQVVQEIAAGKIDIVIGTHRLLQPDISFKDLGLLIIDEEHRFGVGQKERVKRLKKNVDVLALSATPIPRTLYMSLVGIREVSVIETPPTDRLAIRTFVMPAEETVIREAILREIKRGGQVFFVHNEIETIEKVREFLEKLVPEAKIGIGHGQMDEKRLEEIMIRFSHQEFDLLLCTTIIESGLDIPTANTILIHQAEQLGLAQIYQLRGRVGRGSHRAYAYLLISEEGGLTGEARQRLEALQRFSELGSGYRLASYDLEIRGAGNLLGREQSGQMAAIGYELYTELLEKAVRELKGEKILEEIDPELHFRVPSYIPEAYVQDPPVRLELYRRLASLPQEEAIDPILEELQDRFGTPPTEVENLLELSAVKALAKRLRIKQIRYDGKTFVYAFDPSSPLPPELLTERVQKAPKRFRLTPDLRFTVHHPLPEGGAALAETKRFLRELALHLGGS